MVYRNFYLNVIVRVTFIFFTSLWLAYEITNPPFVYTLLFLGSILLIQTFALIWYVNRTNRELSRFFTSLRDKDSSFSIVGKEKGGSFRKLAETLNETAALLKEARIEKESQFLYLQCIVEHVTIGLISFSTNGKVSLINNAAKKLLGIKSIVRLEQLNSIMEGFDRIVNGLNPGEQNVIRMTINNELLQVLIRVTGFKFHNEQLKLISLQDFRQELEEQEIKSWQKLIRVMTHEIMNSVTPITTLTTAIKRCLSTDENIKAIGELEEEDIRDVVVNSDLIEERSKGLIEFVNNYRSISKIDNLSLKNIPVEKLLTSTVNLFREDFKNFNIKTDTAIQPVNLTISLDEKLIQQVLINLVKNSIEALRETEGGRVELNANSEADGTPVIEVSDNGVGIPREILDDIFVPFFTTKKNGSGIGLSLSRQIMRLHKGTIHVASEPGKRTSFFLKF